MLALLRLLLGSEAAEAAVLESGAVAETLKSLEVTPGALAPAFSPAIEAYNTTVLPAGAVTLQLNATAADPAATVYVYSGPAPPAPAPAPRFSCAAGRCEESAHGAFPSSAECAVNCRAPPPPARYSCQPPGRCVTDPNGDYSHSECEAACRPPPPPPPKPPPPPSGGHYRNPYAGPCEDGDKLVQLQQVGRRI